MVVGDYADQGEDWRKIGREMVFPGMNGKLPAVDDAYRQLTSMIGPIEEKVRLAFDFHEPVTHVLYVGVGNGAGWVTKYEGNWAVLFGLEGIVDSGFGSAARLRGLLAHELGHVVHYSWREAHGLSPGNGPWWQLYEEGFAQQCESELIGGDSWHMDTTYPDESWLVWCRENRAWLAAEFLHAVDAGQSVRPFFGSWYEVRGRRQTGYFLGQQVISRMVERMSLQEIALFKRGPALERTLHGVVSELATSGP
jgi:hypothetical protein